VFGARGASSFLTKATKWLAIAFFVLTLSMAIYIQRTGLVNRSTEGDLGVMSGVATPVPQTPPPTGAAATDVPAGIPQSSAPVGDLPAPAAAAPPAATAADVPAADVPATAPSEEGSDEKRE
jgi:preprotein translocase subunit SecG